MENHYNLDTYKKQEIEKAKKKVALVVAGGSGVLTYYNTQNTSISLLTGLLIGTTAMIAYNQGFLGSYFENYANVKTNQFKKNTQNKLVDEVSQIIAKIRSENNLTTQIEEVKKELRKINYEELCILEEELKNQHQKTKLLEILKNNQFLIDILTIK